MEPRDRRKEFFRSPRESRGVPKSYRARQILEEINQYKERKPKNGTYSRPGRGVSGESSN